MEQMVELRNVSLWTCIEGRGIPVVLCNGGPGCDDYLGPVAELLTSYCRVLRFEPRGCGRSDWDGRYDLNTSLRDLEDLRVHFGFDRFLAIGHSAGCDLALAYALRYSHRLLGLIGLAGGRIVNDRDWHATYKFRLETVGESTGGKDFVADPAVNRVGNASWKEFIKDAYLLQQIARLDIPVHFIVAGEDIRPAWPTWQLARLLPQGGVSTISGASHYIWLDHRQALSEELHVQIARICSVPVGSGNR